MQMNPSTGNRSHNWKCASDVVLYHIFWCSQQCRWLQLYNQLRYCYYIYSKVLAADLISHGQPGHAQSPQTAGQMQNPQHQFQKLKVSYTYFSNYSRGQKFKTTTYKISIFQQSWPIIPTDAINRVFSLFLATKSFSILFRQIIYCNARKWYDI